jgi:predicted DNA-binding transcriptional regulator AlpA
MKSHQLIPKEIKMEVRHLNQKQVAERWGVSLASLERWRSEGLGPKFLKIGGGVRYRLLDIEAYEESCLATSTSSRVVQAETVNVPLDIVP